MLSIARATTSQLLGAWSWRLEPGKGQMTRRGLDSLGLCPAAGEIVDIELELCRENKRPDWAGLKAILHSPKKMPFKGYTWQGGWQR